MSVKCGEKLRLRPGYCKNPVVPGRTKCRFHGGASTGPRTPEGKAKIAALAPQKLEKWRNQRRAMKAAGLITHINPPSRKKRRPPPTTDEELIVEAKTQVSERKERVPEYCPHCGGRLDDPKQPKSRSPAPAPALIGENETAQDKLYRLNNRSLDLIDEILSLPHQASRNRKATAAERLRILAIKKDTALSVTSLTARVDSNLLKKQELDMMPEMLRRIANFEEGK